MRNGGVPCGMTERGYWAAEEKVSTPMEQVCRSMGTRRNARRNERRRTTSMSE